MSGTRSLSPRAPATEAGVRSLIVAAHGDRGGLRSNRLTREIVRRMDDSGLFATVAAGYLRAKPALEEVGAELPQGAIAVYPLFMTRGYYVDRAIPERLDLGADGRDGAGRPIRVLEPIGTRPVMARVVRSSALGAARSARFEPEQTRLLLVAHGSTKDRSSREATHALARQVVDSGTFASVDSAFLEEPPFLADMLSTLAEPLVVVGLFIGEGMHGIDDLRRAVAAAGRRDIVLAPPLARSDELVNAACDDILAMLPG